MEKVIVINSDCMGKDSIKLGRQIMASFLRKLCVSQRKPDAIILYNSGVKLASKGSPVLDALEMLYSQKVDIIACGTCVTFFDLNNKIVVGRVSDMQEIVNVLTSEKHIINI